MLVCGEPSAIIVYPQLYLDPFFWEKLHMDGTSESSPTGEEQKKEIYWDCKLRALEQAEEGYKNAQEIIRFVDTKTGVIVTFVLVCIGLVLEVVKEFFALPEDIRKSLSSIFENHTYWFICIIALC